MGLSKHHSLEGLEPKHQRMNVRLKIVSQEEVADSAFSSFNSKLEET